MNAIDVKNLTKKYGSVTAVEDLSFHVEKGQVFGLLGAVFSRVSARYDFDIQHRNAGRRDCKGLENCRSYRKHTLLPDDNIFGCDPAL